MNPNDNREDNPHQQNDQQEQKNEPEYPAKAFSHSILPGLFSFVFHFGASWLFRGVFRRR
jgi:hypothetical protein